MMQTCIVSNLSVSNSDMNITNKVIAKDLTP